MKFPGVAIATLILLGVSSTLFPAAPETRDMDAQLKTAQAHFAQEREADTWWYYGWLGFSGGVFATSTTLYFATEKDTVVQKAQPISMAVSGAGVLSLILLKPRSFSAEAELKSMPEDTVAEKQAKLRRSEYWLEHAAARQRFTTGTVAQVGTVSFLGLASLADAIWFNGPAFALLRFVLSLAVAELKIFTQPTYSRDLSDRRNKTTPFAWHVRALPGEVAVVAYF